MNSLLRTAAGEFIKKTIRSNNVLPQQSTFTIENNVFFSPHSNEYLHLNNVRYAYKKYCIRCVDE